MEDKKAEESPTTISAAVARLLSGDSGQKLLMALVVVAGGGNLWNTSNSNRISQEEIERALNEVHQLHDMLQPTLDRQKQMAEEITTIKNTVKPSP
jgi:hypothetical protein